MSQQKAGIDGCLQRYVNCRQAALKSHLDDLGRHHIVMKVNSSSTYFEPHARGQDASDGTPAHGRGSEHFG